jgi:hypothetical protein
MVLGDVLAAGIKSAAKNGKKALKNGVKNGVNGVVNGNGIKNGVDYAKKAAVAKHLEKWNYNKSALSKTGFRKNLKAFAYKQREIDPNITPKQIQNVWEETIGTRIYEGEEQMLLSGGSKPTKSSDISIEGQRRIQVQDRSKNQGRKDKLQKIRNEHGFTSISAKKNFDNLNGLVATENRNIKAAGGKHHVILEHDIALVGGKQWWNKVGNKGNDNANLYINRIPEAREFKNNIEYWFYNFIKNKGNNWVLKTDRSNMKDLIIVEVSNGKELGRIPMPTGYSDGIPEDSKAITIDILKKLAEGFKG